MPGCFDPTYCPDDPPVPQLQNAFYQIPPRGTMKFQDGEAITYTCENSIYRFPQDESITPKKDWSDQLTVVCGWENEWDPPYIQGCVDPRGCQPPPARTDRVWGSFEDSPFGFLDVGTVYWYECRRGVFELTNGTQLQYIDLTCINDPYGGPPYWEPSGKIPPIDGDANPFPNCVLLRKYISFYHFQIMS